RPRVAERIFAADEGQLTPAITLNSSHSLWFDLTAVEPARDQTLEEVGDEVRAALMAERTQEALAAEAERVVAELDAGRALSDIASGLGEEVVRSAPFGRGGAELSAIGPEVAAAAFSGGSDHHGAARNAEGDYVVFAVAEVVPAAEATEEVANFLEQSARDSLFSEFVGGIRDQAGLRVNQQVFSQVVGLDGAAGQ